MLADAFSMMAASNVPGAAMTTAVGPHTTRVDLNPTTVEINSWLQNIIYAIVRGRPKSHEKGAWKVASLTTILALRLMNCAAKDRR
jgi:hypothetical protein